MSGTPSGGLLEPDTAAASQITDHVFMQVREDWWKLCGVCGLAQSAHRATGLPAAAVLEQEYGRPVR